MSLVIGTKITTFYLLRQNSRFSFNGMIKSPDINDRFNCPHINIYTLYLFLVLKFTCDGVKTNQFDFTSSYK